MKRFALVLGTMAVLTAVSGSQLLAQNLPPYSPAGGAVFVSAFPTSSAPVGQAAYTSAFPSEYGPGGAPGCVQGGSMMPPGSGGLPSSGYNWSQMPAAMPPAMQAYGPPGNAPCNGGDAAGTCDTGDATEDLPRWSISAGVTFLHLPTPQARTLVYDFGVGPTDVLLNASDMGVEWGEGPRIDALWHFDQEWDLELLYFSVSNWDRENTITSPSSTAQDYGHLHCMRSFR